MKDWKGRRVLITGAAAGIGRALARQLAPRGALLILTSRRGPPLLRAAEELRSAGGSVEAHVLDVTDAAGILRVRDEIHARGGPIDVLINNAGVVFGGPFLAVPLDRHLATFATNTVGVVAMVHAFLPDLIARPEAHLVNVASAAGLAAVPFATSYASSKWSIIGFSESLRLELAELGYGHVKVTTVCPMYVATGMFEGAQPPRTTSMMSPDLLAAKVIRAVEQERVFLRTPWIANCLPLLNGVLPGRWLDTLLAAMGATRSMRSWIGHGSAGAAPREAPAVHPPAARREAPTMMTSRARPSGTPRQGAGRSP